jgi:hypothetical protein
MANIEILRPSQTYSADLTITHSGATSGTLTTSATLPIFSSSVVLGYVVKSGAIVGTLALTHTAASGLSRFTATVSTTPAAVDLVITVYWTTPVPTAGLSGLVQV